MTAPLIQRLLDEFHYPMLNDAGALDRFTAASEHSVIFFTQDPQAFPETNDVAVILPELMTVFDGRIQAAVIGPEMERPLFNHYRLDAFPALVFLRKGEYLGAITRVQDWDFYLRRIEALLAARPASIPGIDVAVQTSSAGACGGCTHC